MVEAFSFRSPDAETTRLAARLLGEAIPFEGLVVALVGALGSGKTVFAKGLGEGLGLDPCTIASPTFAIAAEYPPARPDAPGLVHVDLYRVASEADLEAAGWLDWLGARCVLAVEWSDRFPDALPRERLEVHLERGAADSTRSLAVRPSGRRAEACARAWRRALAALGLAGLPVERPPEPESEPESETDSESGSGSEPGPAAGPVAKRESESKARWR